MPNFRRHDCRSKGDAGIYQPAYLWMNTPRGYLRYTPMGYMLGL